MILPLILITFLRLDYVLSTSNHSLVFSYKVGMISNNEGRKNLRNLLGTLTSQTLTSGFYNFSSTITSPEDPNQIHGLYLCRGDIVDPHICQSCIISIKKYIYENSYYGNKGLVWYDNCMVRYSNESFLGKLNTKLWGASWDNSKIKGSRNHFMKLLRDTMKALAIKASNGLNGNKFASKVVMYTRFDSLYTMVQCTPDLLARDCYRCLKSASQMILSFRGSISGVVLYSSCMAQYKTTLSLSNKDFTIGEFKPLMFFPPKEAVDFASPFSLKVRLEISPLSNTTLNSSSTTPSLPAYNCTVTKLKGPQLYAADRSECSMD